MSFEKNFIGIYSWIPFLACAGVVLATPSVKAERSYDFRKRLSVVHEEARRDVSLKPAADEIELSDGMLITVPNGEKGLVFRAAQDFQDYMAVSMGVSATIVEKGKVSSGKTAGIEISMCPDLPPRTSEFKTDDSGVHIAASDERAAQHSQISICYELDIIRG